MRLPIITHRYPLKNILAWILFIAVTAWVVFVIMGQAHAEEQPYVPHTPTGCAYGDSIPVDSDKCAPTPDIPVSQNVETEDKPVESVENWGK